MTLDASEIRERLNYNPETGIFHWQACEERGKAWNTRFMGKQAFTYKSKRGYLVTNIRVDGKPVNVLAHRAAWAHVYGEWPTGQIDHINGNRTDNRIANLRDVVNAENAKNMALKSSNSSGVSGVYWHKQTGKWCAQINAHGKTVGLGLYAEKSEAIIARKAAERVLGYHKNHGRPS